MKELLKLLTVTLFVSAACAEDVVVKADADAKPEAVQDTTTVEKKTEEKHDDATAHAAPVAEHVVHINRKAANDLTMRLSKDQGPWKGPMTEIPVPACCADAAAAPAAVHAPKAAAHKAKATHKAATHADAKPEAKAAAHVDAEPEAKAADHKDTAEATGKAVETAVETTTTSAK